MNLIYVLIIRNNACVLGHCNDGIAKSGRTKAGRSAV